MEGRRGGILVQIGIWDGESEFQVYTRKFRLEEGVFQVPDPPPT